MCVGLSRLRVLIYRLNYLKLLIRLLSILGNGVRAMRGVIFIDKLLGIILFIVFAHRCQTRY